MDMYKTFYNLEAMVGKKLKLMFQLYQDLDIINIW